MVRIRNQFKKIDFNNLTYFCKGNAAPINFIGFKGPLHIFKSIYNGSIPLEDVEKEQIEPERNLNHIKQGNPKNRSDKQDDVIDDVTNLHESRQRVVQMFIDYPREKSRRIYESKQRKGLKILTPNQMLKRLPIALAQIKTGNNSESLLNEIREIVYSLYRSKEISKKVYNNIIKSIKV